MEPEADHSKMTLTRRAKRLFRWTAPRLSMNGTKVNSKQMHIWFWEVAEPTNDGKNKWRFEPSKLLADGDVRFDSDRLEGNCREAAVFWPPPVEPINPNTNPPAFGQLESQPPAKRNATRLKHPAKRYVVARTAYTGTILQQELAAPLVASPPLQSRTRFVGVQVQLQMLGGPDKGAVDKMRVDGDVAVRQMQTENGIEKTKLDIRGQALEVITRGEDLYRMIVLGAETEPAVVTAQELTLQGTKITLDQPANRLWIDGPGRLKMQNLQQSNQMTEHGSRVLNASARTGEKQQHGDNGRQLARRDGV